MAQNKSKLVYHHTGLLKTHKSRNSGSEKLANTSFFQASPRLGIPNRKGRTRGPQKPSRLSSGAPAPSPPSPRAARPPPRSSARSSWRESRGPSSNRGDLGFGWVPTTNQQTTNKKLTKNKKQPAKKKSDQTGLWVPICPYSFAQVEHTKPAARAARGGCPPCARWRRPCGHCPR